MAEELIVATGGGFIGADLVRRLVADGARVRAIDQHPLEN
jgi:nucleoside-diphosphate-sugar epimerase